jgi:signal-transduction protein with cAMP-binding, CBS, and nucleotidyltransferase domain
MRVSEIMSKDVTVCTEDTGLEEVYELLQKSEDGLVIVVDSDAHRVPIGITSEHRICEQIIARGRNPKTLTAGSVMDGRIKKITEHDSIESIRVEDGDLRAAMIVVNNDRQVIGVVPHETVKRFARAAARNQAAGITLNPSPAATRRVSEIPAFGWIQ